MNIVTLIGSVVDVPRMVRFNSEPLRAFLRLRVPREGSSKADMITVEAIGPVAEFVVEHLDVSAEVAVDGRLERRDRTAHDVSHAMVVVAEHVLVMGSGARSDQHRRRFEHLG